MKYEISFIISSTVPENEHGKIQEQVLSYLDEAKAQHDKEFFSLGRKKLAYPIKKQKNGFYIFMVFDLEEKANLKELDTKLKHNNNILRHLIIKKDKESTKTPAEEIKQLNKEGVRDSRGANDTPVVKKDAPEDKVNGEAGEGGLGQKKEVVKVNLDDIDKKLDDLLDV